MITDIRDHGGNYGGAGGLEPRGIQLEGPALDLIKRGDFISINASSTSEPTHSITQTATTFAGPTSSYTEFQGMNSLISDAGNTIILSVGTNGQHTFLKPGLNDSGVVSAVVIGATYYSHLYGITKIGPNKFIIIHASANLKGMAISFIEINDITGNLEPIITTIIQTESNLKSAKYVPFSEDNLQGVIFYSTGNYPLGTTDNVTTKFATLNIDGILNTVTIGVDQTVQYTTGESYGHITNLLYKDANTVVFHTHKNTYKMAYNDGVPIVTVGALAWGFGTPVIYLRSKGIIIVSNGSRLSKIVYNHSNDSFVRTELSPSTDYRYLFSMRLDMVDRDFLLYNYKKINPLLTRSIGYMGNFRFMTVVGTEAATKVSLISLQLESSFSTCVATSIGVIGSANLYVNNDIWINFSNGSSACSIIYPVYWHVDGYSSTRNPYSIDISISKPTLNYAISSSGDDIHGISTKETTINGTARGIFKKDDTLKFTIGE